MDHDSPSYGLILVVVVIVSRNCFYFCDGLLAAMSHQLNFTVFLKNLSNPDLKMQLKSNNHLVFSIDMNTIYSN